MGEWVGAERDGGLDGYSGQGSHEILGRQAVVVIAVAQSSYLFGSAVCLPRRC